MELLPRNVSFFYALGNKKQNFVFVLLFHSFALTLQRVAVYVNKSHLYYK